MQDGGHSVPLAWTKPTFVRIYAYEVLGISGDSVSAQLHGFSNGSPLPGSPVQPIANANLNLDAPYPSRSETDRTHLFLLPYEWTIIKNIELQAELNPDNFVYEQDYGNNLYPAAAKPFAISSPYVCLVTFPVAATTPAGATVIFDNDPAVYDPRMERAKTLLPVMVHVEKEVVIIWKEQGDGDPVPHTLPDDENEAQLLAAIGETGALTDPPAGCLQSVTRYAGIVDETADFVADFGGRASDNQFWARWWDAESTFDYILPAGGFLWAHETGHTLGRPHVDCADAGNPGFYPYPRCQNDNDDSWNAGWGYDPISGAAPNPVDNPDLMAYGAPRWVSDFTWKCIYNYVSDILGLPLTGVAGCDDPLAAASVAQEEQSPANTSAGTIVAGSGLISSTGFDLISLITYQRLEQLTAAQQSTLSQTPRTGEWQAILFDALDNELARQLIKAGEEIDDSDSKRFNLLNFALMTDSTPARIEIRDTASAKLLFDQTISRNAPKLVFNSAMTNSEGDIIVEFEANDADGDALKIVAQYIDPNGRKQILFHNRGQGRDSYSCDPCTWPGRTLHGGEGVVRLFASDGLRTAMLERRVTVPDKPPEVSIVATQHGLVDDDGFATIGLQAVVYDAEQGKMKEPPGIIWSWGKSITHCGSCGNALAGEISGEPLIFLSRENALAEGFESTVVKIQLKVTDGAGQSSMASVEVDLQPQKLTSGKQFLPVVLSPRSS